MSALGFFTGAHTPCDTEVMIQIDFVVVAQCHTTCDLHIMSALGFFTGAHTPCDTEVMFQIDFVVVAHNVTTWVVY